jgi:hypothetical protein
MNNYKNTRACSWPETMALTAVLQRLSVQRYLFLALALTETRLQLLGVLVPKVLAPKQFGFSSGRYQPETLLKAANAKTKVLLTAGGSDICDAWIVIYHPPN